MTKEHLITPLLDILQAGSPEIQQASIPGAKPGDFICRALGEVYPGATGISVVPVGINYVYNEWSPRDKGGGLVAVHQPDSEFVKKLRARTPFGKLKTESGNEVVETFYLLVIALLADGSTRRFGVPFTSTKIPRYKQLVTKANAITVQIPSGARITPPFFSHRYRFKTIFVEKKGFKWHNYASIDFDGTDAVSARLDPRGVVYLEAKAFADQNKKGEVKIDANQAAPHDDDHGSDGAPADAGASDSPPF